MADVLITPASGKVEFKDGSNNIDGKIELDGSGNLNITAPGGDLVLGDTTSDIFIGNGINNIDIVFEQSGEIRPTSGRTLTIGDTVGTLRLESDAAINVNKEFTITSQGGIDHKAHGVASGNSVENRLRSSWTAGFDRWYMYPIKDGASNFNRELTYDFSNNYWIIEGTTRFPNGLVSNDNLTVCSTLLANNVQVVGSLTLDGTEVLDASLLGLGTVPSLSDQNSGSVGDASQSYIVFDSTNELIFHKDVSNALNSPVGAANDADMINGQVFKMVGNVFHKEGHITGATTLTLDFTGSDHIDVVASASTTGALNIRADSITADRIKAGAISADKLSVKAVNFVNPVSFTETLNGWGGADEETGTGVTLQYLTYDANFNALEIANNISGGSRVDDVAARSDTWQLDDNKIYKVTVRVSASSSGAVSGIWYFGIAGFGSATDGTVSTTDSTNGTTTFRAYDANRTSQGTGSTFHFVQNANKTEIDGANSFSALQVYYVIGKNRSIEECPDHYTGGLASGTIRPYIKDENTDTTYAALRLLNYNSGTSLNQSVYFKDITVTELGTGVIVADNIKAGAIETDKLAASAVTADKIQANSINATKIAASSITGTEISATAKIVAGSGNNVGVLDGADGTYRIYAGHATPSSAPFRVTQAGALTATSATIVGSISATSGSFNGTLSASTGSIGGFTIGATSLIAGSGVSRVSVATSGIHLGNNTFGSAPFRVTPAGALTATNATITGNITANSGSFNGTLSASTGSIGGFTIGATSLIAGSGASRVSVATSGIHLGNNTFGSAPFRVTPAGALTATNATIAGSISATSGTFAGSLVAATGTFSGALTAQSVSSQTIVAGAVTTDKLTAGVPFPYEGLAYHWPLDANSSGSSFTNAVYEVITGAYSEIQGTQAGNATFSTESPTGKAYRNVLNRGIELLTDAEADALESATGNGFAWSFWFKSEETTGTSQARIITRDVSDGWAVTVNQTASSQALTFHGEPGSESMGSVDVDTWHHIAFSENGSGTITIFLDGNNVGTEAYTPVASSRPVALGCNTEDALNTSSEVFRGLISDVRAYNRALSQAEVRAIYNAVGVAAEIHGDMLVSGTVTADKIVASSITGTQISSATTITAGTGNNVGVLDGADATYRIYAGNATPASAPFRVTQAGALTATNATITGAITATSGSFTGSITANSGSIGGFTIDSSTLFTGTKDVSGYTTTGISINGGGNGSFHSKNFYIDTSGNAFFKGALSGASGTFSGTLTAQSISAGNIQANSISSGNIQAGTITGDKLVIGDVTNLVRNARFADDRNEWTLGDEVTDATWGTALRLVGNGVNIQDSRQVDPKIPVVPGEKYYCEIYLRTDTGITNVSNGLGFGFFEYQENGTSLGATPYRRTNLNPATYIGSSWTKESQVFTTSSDAYYIVPWVTLRENVSGSAYYTNYVIRKMTGTTTIEDDAITTDKIVASAITATEIQASAITASKIQADAITGTKIDSSTTITAGTGNNVGVLDGADGTYRIYAGNATPASAPFRVTQTGALTATNATITGAITATSGSFTGSITANSGSIGGFTIDSGGIRKGTNGNRISLSTAGIHLGAVTSGSAPFAVSNAGALTATNATITGDITATSGSFNGTLSASTGSIGGFTIGATSLIAGSGVSRVSVATSGIHLGNNTFGSAPFRVTPAGALTATNATITGNITANSGSFNGTLSASTGSIGGFTIGATSLIAGSGTTRVSVATSGIHLGNNTFGSAPFRVTTAGALTATNATITGAITATSGSISDSVTIGGGTAGTLTTGEGFTGAGSVNYNPDITIVAPDGRPDGIKAVYGSATTSNIKYQDAAKTILELSSTSDSSIGAGWPAFKVNPDAKYKIFIRWKASAAVSSGVYFRIQELDAELSAGNTHVSNSGGGNEAGVQQSTRQITSFYDNSSLGTSFQENEFTYTPTSTCKYASAIVLNWTGVGTNEIHVDKLYIVEDTLVKDRGSVGGWTIDSEAIYSGTKNITGTGYASAGITIRSASGASIHAEQFYLDKNGNASFRGTVSASAGNIGGWTIDSSTLFTGTKDVSAYTTTGISINGGGNGSFHSKNFYIDTSGNAFFKGALSGASGTFSGTLTAQSISAGNIQADAITASSLQVSSNTSGSSTMFFDGTNNRIDIKDSAGALRVRIGKLT